MTPSWMTEALPFQRKPRRARVARESEALTGYGDPESFIK